MQGKPSLLQAKPLAALDFAEGGKQYKVYNHGQVMHQGAAYLLAEICSEDSPEACARDSVVPHAPLLTPQHLHCTAADSSASYAAIDISTPTSAGGTESPGTDSPGSAIGPGSRGVRRRRRAPSAAHTVTDSYYRSSARRFT